jgi:hypothetical protein
METWFHLTHIRACHTHPDTTRQRLFIWEIHTQINGKSLHMKKKNQRRFAQKHVNSSKTVILRHYSHGCCYSLSFFLFFFYVQIERNNRYIYILKCYVYMCVLVLVSHNQNIVYNNRLDDITLPQLLFHDPSPEYIQFSNPSNVAGTSPVLKRLPFYKRKGKESCKHDVVK